MTSVTRSTGYLQHYHQDGHLSLETEMHILPVLFIGRIVRIFGEKGGISDCKEDAIENLVSDIFLKK